MISRRTTGKKFRDFAIGLLLSGGAMATVASWAVDREKERKNKIVHSLDNYVRNIDGNPETLTEEEIEIFNDEFRQITGYGVRIMEENGKKVLYREVGQGEKIHYDNIAEFLQERGVSVR